MLTFAKFLGGAQQQATFGSDHDLNLHAGRLVMLGATTTGLAVVLPDARDVLMLGGPHACIVNTGANDYDVEDNDGNALVTLEPDTAAVVYLGDATTAAGVWATVKLDVLTP